MNRQEKIANAALRHHDSLIYTIESLIRVAREKGIKDSTIIQAERILQNVKEDIYGSNSGGKQPNTFQLRR